MTWWDFDEVRDVDAIMGAFMLVRREAMAQVGMMDDSYFMYSEEIDWCYRFRQHGWRVLYNPDVVAVHLWGGSSKRVRQEMLIQLYRSKVEFFRKHYGALSATLLKGIIGFAAFLRVGPGALVYLTSGDSHKRDKHRAFVALLQATPTF